MEPAAAAAAAGRNPSAAGGGGTYTDPLSICDRLQTSENARSNIGVHINGATPPADPSLQVFAVPQHPLLTPIQMQWVIDEAERQALRQLELQSSSFSSSLLAKTTSARSKKRRTRVDALQRVARDKRRRKMLGANYEPLSTTATKQHGQQPKPPYYSTIAQHTDPMNIDIVPPTGWNMIDDAMFPPVHHHPRHFQDPPNAISRRVAASSSSDRYQRLLHDVDSRSSAALHSLLHTVIEERVLQQLIPQVYNVPYDIPNGNDFPKTPSSSSSSSSTMPSSASASASSSSGHFLQISDISIAKITHGKGAIMKHYLHDGVFGVLIPLFEQEEQQQPYSSSSSSDLSSSSFRDGAAAQVPYSSSSSSGGTSSSSSSSSRSLRWHGSQQPQEKERSVDDTTRTFSTIEQAERYLSDTVSHQHPPSSSSSSSSRSHRGSAIVFHPSMLGLAERVLPAYTYVVVAEIVAPFCINAKGAEAAAVAAAANSGDKWFETLPDTADDAPLLQPKQQHQPPPATRDDDTVYLVEEEEEEEREQFQQMWKEEKKAIRYDDDDDNSSKGNDNKGDGDFDRRQLLLVTDGDNQNDNNQMRNMPEKDNTEVEVEL